MLWGAEDNPEDHNGGPKESAQKITMKGTTNERSIHGSTMGMITTTGVNLNNPSIHDDAL